MTRSKGVLREGLVVGLIAYAAVAAFYAIFDVLAARGGLYTLNLLGRALFRGLRDPAVLQLPLQYDTSAMLSYNAVHLFVSLAIGLIVASLVAMAERRPSQALVPLAIIVGGFIVTIVAVGYLTNAVRELLPWWSIVVANSLAVLVAGWYFLERHPGLLHTLFGAGGRARATSA